MRTIATLASLLLLSAFFVGTAAATEVKTTPCPREGELGAVVWVNQNHVTACCAFGFIGGYCRNPFS